MVTKAQERDALFENFDKLQDQQRIMAWFALFLPLLLLLGLATLASVEIITALVGPLATYIGAMGTIIVAFMAVTGWTHASTIKPAE